MFTYLFYKVKCFSFHIRLLATDDVHGFTTLVIQARFVTIVTYPSCPHSDQEKHSCRDVVDELKEGLNLNGTTAEFAVVLPVGMVGLCALMTDKAMHIIPKYGCAFLKMVILSHKSCVISLLSELSVNFLLYLSYVKSQ